MCLRFYLVLSMSPEYHRYSGIPPALPPERPVLQSNQVRHITVMLSFIHIYYCTQEISLITRKNNVHQFSYLEPGNSFYFYVTSY